MKYNYIYAILLILVIAIGCSKAQEPTTAPTDVQTTQTDSEPIVQETTPSADISYELSSDEEVKALDMEMGKKTKISTPYKIMQIGNVYVFGIGIKNVMPNDTKFKINVNFKEAKTTGGLATLIEKTDDETMLTWIGRNRFSVVNIEGNGEKVIPLIIEVMPEMGAGENTIPGSYVFNVDIEYESSSNAWDDYEPNTLTIKVKE